MRLRYVSSEYRLRSSFSGKGWVLLFRVKKKLKTDCNMILGNLEAGDHHFVTAAGSHSSSRPVSYEDSWNSLYWSIHCSICDIFVLMRMRLTPVVITKCTPCLTNVNGVQLKAQEIWEFYRRQGLIQINPVIHIRQRTKKPRAHSRKSYLQASL